MISSELLPSVITAPKARFSAKPEVLGEFMVDELGYPSHKLPRVSVRFPGRHLRLLSGNNGFGSAKPLWQDGGMLRAFRPTHFSPDFRVAITVSEGKLQDGTENTLIHELTHGAQYFNRPEIIQTGMSTMLSRGALGASVGALASELCLGILINSAERDTSILSMTDMASTIVTWASGGAVMGLSIGYYRAVHEVEAREVAESLTPSGLLYRVS